MQTKIPGETRDAHFPEPAPEHLNWLPRVFAAPGQVSRRVLPCDDAGVSLGIDRRVLLPAERNPEELQHAHWAVPPSASSSGRGYTPDRDFGTADPSVVFSETAISYGPNSFVFIDIINQRDNAILFTRVSLLNRPIKGGAVSGPRRRTAGSSGRWPSG